MKKLLIGLLALGSLSSFADCTIRFDAQVDSEDVGINIVLGDTPLIETVYLGDGSYQRFVSVSQTKSRNDYPLSLVPVPKYKVKVPINTDYVGLFSNKLKISRIGLLDILEAPQLVDGKYIAKAKFQDDELAQEQDVVLQVDQFCFRKY